MASRTASSHTSASDQLSFMQKLSDNVFLHRAVVPTTETSTDPRLVLILGWMDARNAHLARYIREYRKSYPTSDLLLVKARLTTLTWASAGQSDVGPAVAPIREICGDYEPTRQSARPRLLVHAFSGGGSCLLYHLYNHFSRHNLLLPQHITVFDSTPGVWSYGFNVNVLDAPLKSMLKSMPPWMRLSMLPVIHLIAMVYWVRIRVLHSPDNQATWSTAHNDESKVKELRRVYVYGDMDKICPAAAIEAHAIDAQSKGFSVQLEFFKGSSHVVHMMNDTERYWGIVRQTWGAVQKPRL